MTVLPQDAPGRPEKMPALTSIRFFAAFYVVIYHSLFLVNPIFAHPIDYGQSSLFTRFVSLGYVSVSFFFLLSGYILAAVYLRNSEEVPLQKFYVARFARVYPLFLLTLIADSPYLFFERLGKYGAGIATAKTTASFAASALMLQAWIPRLGGINFPSWSLSVEAFLYLIFPFLGVLLWRVRASRAWPVALALYVAGQLAVLIAGRYFSPEIVSRQPLLHVSTFAFGILLARSQFSRDGSQKRMTSSVVRFAGVITIVGALAAVALFPRLSFNSVNDGLLSPLFACAILCLSQCGGMLRRVLGAGSFVILGEASYGLYLVHIPLLHAYLGLGLDRKPVLYPLYLVACIGLSIASFYLFESPARRWIQTRASRSKAPASRYILQEGAKA